MVWHTLTTARAEWPGGNAPFNDPALTELLTVAREQVEAFGKVIPVTVPVTPVPDRYRLAQLMQARNLWNAGKADTGSNGGFGDESFTIYTFPMDNAVKNIIRPKSGVPRFG